MAEEPGTRPILVAVDNPHHVEQLVRTAGDLARVADGLVRIVSVVVKSYDSPFSLYTDETIVERFSGERRVILETAAEIAPDDVDVEGEVVVGRSVPDGILEAVAHADPSALVIGWQERSGRTDAVLGTNVDRLTERAPCDLYVERIGREADGVDSILLPVAGGPHVRPAAAASKAIAARNDAPVYVLSVEPSDVEPGTAREFVERAVAALRRAPGPDVRIETRVLDGDDVTAAIVEAASEHDVLVFGATRRGAIHRRLVGSIPRAVVRRTDRTVLLARSGDAVGGPFLGTLGRLWRRERETAESS